MQETQTNNFADFDASTIKVGIVIAQFNNNITEKILKSALKKLEDFKVNKNNISTWKVAGSVEIPVVLNSAAKSKKYDVLIAIGAIVKGETDHYDYVAKITTEGVLRAMMDYNIPIGFAVLTTQNKELAEARTSIGSEAVVAAMHTNLLIKNIE